MPRVEREASVVWEGSAARGAGSLTAASSGAFAGLPFTEPSRVGEPDGRTSPEELLAAAHACCYAMSLATELSATVTLDEVEGEGHRIVGSHLSVRASAPGVADLEAVAARADAGCPFSALIRASGTVSVDAQIAG